MLWIHVWIALCLFEMLAVTYSGRKSHLSGVMVSVLATRSKVRRFKRGQGNGFLKVTKTQQHTFLGRGSKAWCSMS
jgi:hypothetical protein